MISRLFRRTRIDQLIRDAVESEHTLKRSLGPFSLMALGLSSIVGFGALILPGILSARYAGPAVLISIGISSLVALLVALCYAELAGMVPVAGSAYTYGYATLGELPAWIIAWELLLEYTFGAAMVAWGWSGYFNSLLRVLGFSLPAYLSGSPINLAGAVLILLATCVLLIGIRESASTNNLMVIVKLSILPFFVIVGMFFLAGHAEVARANLSDFMPRTIQFGEFGWSGVARAAAVFFVAFLGIDAVGTAAEEAKNPRRDIPIAMTGSVVLACILFGLSALVLVSTVNYRNLDVADPLAVGMDRISLLWGSEFLHWGSVLITLGALVALTGTLIIMLLGASRVLFSVSRDGLLPRGLSSIHPKFLTPIVATILVGLSASVLAGILPFDWLANLFSIGVLSVFLMTCIGVAVLRVRDPSRRRAFRVPLLGVVVSVCIPSVVLLILCLPAITWIRFVVWLALGFCIYFLYGVEHSHLPRMDTKMTAGDTADQVTPEMLFVSRLLKGALRLLLGILVMVAILTGLTALLPKVESAFPASVATLSVLAIVSGTLFALTPGLRRLRSSEEVLPPEVAEVDEFLKKSREGSDGY